METSVYISGQGMRLAVGSPSKGKLKLKKLLTVPVPKDSIINGIITNEWAIKQTVAEVWAKNKLPKNIRIVIDSSSVNLKPMTVPLTKDGNIISIIKREFADNDNADKLLFDFSVEKPLLEEGGASIIAYAAEKTFIGSYVDIFSELKGAKIRSINIAQNCCINFMRANKLTAQKTAILAVVDGNILSLMLFQNGAYSFSNRSRLLSDPDTPEYTDEISNAISSIIQFHRAGRSGFELTDIYFCGLGENSVRVLNMIGLLFDRFSVSELETDSDFVSRMQPGDKPADYIYCLGNLIKI